MVLEWPPATYQERHAGRAPLTCFGKETPVQSVIHLTVSAVAGIMLVLASLLLASPLLAVLVALVCIMVAWLTFSRAGRLMQDATSERNSGKAPGLCDFDRSTPG